MSDVALRPMLFAREAHKNHIRKYTNNPYVDHLAEVAGITATVRERLYEIERVSY